MTGHFIHYLKIFSLALVISGILTFVIKWLARRFNVLDNPGLEKIHARPTPRLGGIAIFIGFIASILIFSRAELGWPPKIFNPGIIIGSAIALFIGTIDDIKRVPAVIKLIALFIITFILSEYGVILKLPIPYWANLILTLLWLVGITSAFNALDNMDGLAAGLAFIASGTYLAIAIQTYQWEWGILAVGLMGASLGFLIHNFHPASIFMGDSGSFFLGFTLAAMGIMGSWSTHPVKASIIPIIILGVPLFDFAYIVITRQIKGKTKTIKEIIYYTGHDHLSHRIRQLGLNTPGAVIFIYLLAICLSIGAIILRNMSGLEAIFLLGQFILVIIIVIILMELGMRQKK